jgi:hypothetical protein
MLRRLVLLLLVLVLPAQALAGAFVHVCRHDLAAAHRRSRPPRQASTSTAR